MLAWVPAGKSWTVANKPGKEMKLMVLEFKDKDGKRSMVLGRAPSQTERMRTPLLSAQHCFYSWHGEPSKECVDFFHGKREFATGPQHC